jgi:hypothetical protein
MVSSTPISLFTCGMREYFTQFFKKKIFVTRLRHEPKAVFTMSAILVQTEQLMCCVMVKSNISNSQSLIYELKQASKMNRDEFSLSIL